MKVRHDASGNSFQPFAEGTYDLRVTDIIEGTSNNGNPQFRLMAEVLSGDDERLGDSAAIFYTITAKTGWKLNMLAKATGVESEETGEMTKDGEPVLEFDTDDLIGCYMQVDCTQSTYNGKIQNRWDNERPSPLDPDGDVAGTEGIEDVEDIEDAEEDEPVAEAKPAAPVRRRRRKAAS